MSAPQPAHPPFVPKNRCDAAPGAPVLCDRRWLRAMSLAPDMSFL